LQQIIAQDHKINKKEIVHSETCYDLCSFSGYICTVWLARCL